MLAVVLIVANSTRGGSSLFTFVILLSTSAVLVVYLAGTISAWRLVSSLGARSLLIVAFLFVLFAFYGAGFQANAWSLVLLAIGVAVRVIGHRLPGQTAPRAALVAPTE